MPVDMKDEDTAPVPGQEPITPVEGITADLTPEEQAVILRACQFAGASRAGQSGSSAESRLVDALAIAVILHRLRMDHEGLVAAIIHSAVEGAEPSEIEKVFGKRIARLVDGVARMGRISEFHDGGQTGKRRENVQAEGLRKLLLAMAEDVRVVLIKLAERLHLMRTLGVGEADRQRRLARETLDIYAPLANRLGIWQIKWELEDLSLRYLEPRTYLDIVRLLDEKRTGREHYIDNVVHLLSEELDKAGIKATVSGRPKHIYSIWRKMQSKNLDFQNIFDVRAVRVLVPEIRDCYAALGVVHGLWRHIPNEFDDYIANPKQNDYRSLHTAVIGPGGRTLEVQIRTYEMHRYAEMGVAAHWRYKEGGRVDAGYEQKIAWLRQLLEWKQEEPSARDFVDRFRSEAFQERVYVFTPQGRVVDLPKGATVLDFAYYIHTDIGHSCRGAKVDGRMVTLTRRLGNGEQVEILTTRRGGPSRDWLNPQLGYLVTSRARAKVRTWFKQQDHDKIVAAGRGILDKELRRIGISGLKMEQLARRLGFREVDDLFAAIGRGELTSTQLAGAAHDLVSPQQEIATEMPIASRRSTATETGGFEIYGVGNLLTTTARCCRPVPEDSIVGYITRGRGVTIHRSDCPNILRLKREDRDRLIEVEWGRQRERTHPVDVQIVAYDRPALLRDISSVLANERINVTGVNTTTDKKRMMARMELTLEITDMGQLSHVLARILQLPNVIEANRKI
jgi:GTP pyrophosphokinase